MRLAFAALLLSLPLLSAAADPAWRAQDSGVTIELRGLSVVDARTAFASGTGGTVLRTRDGETWEKRLLPDAAALDFRDIEALDAHNIVALSAGPGAASRIYRSSDGGESWQLAATNADADGFWDAIAFFDAKRGLLFGDPVKGRFQVLRTEDGGKTWQAIPEQGMPPALANEGAFAASGTCLTVLKGGKEAWFVTGGAAVSRVFRSTDGGLSWQVSTSPVPAGAPTMGLFSAAFADAKFGLATGGDYKQGQPAPLNGAFSEDGGTTWKALPITPAGYMSAVAMVPGTNSFAAAGLAGIGMSAEGGKDWKVASTTPVNSIAFADATHGWAIGPKGTILRYAP